MKYPAAAWPVFPFPDSRRLLIGGLLTVLAACSDNPMAPSSPGVDPGPSGVSVNNGSDPVSTYANPLNGARLYVAPSSNAKKQADSWRQSRPADAAQMDKIASQPQAIWFGDWNPEPYQWVNDVTRKIRSTGALPVYVLYNIPSRDCGLYSSGGAANKASYARWISEVGRGIGPGRAVVVLEPDALAGMDCLSAGDQQLRQEMIRDAVVTLKAIDGLTVYIDAGNSRWHSPEEIGKRLRSVGIDRADGFSLNISNFLATDELVRYGDAVSREVGGKHYVVDTSRNGAGPSADLNWCNPDGRALGPRPTTSTGHALADAFLWLKAPGESDGDCNGGPRSGLWWAEYALGLAQRAAWGS